MEINLSSDILQLVSAAAEKRIILVPGLLAVAIKSEFALSFVRLYCLFWQCVRKLILELFYRRKQLCCAGQVIGDLKKYGCCEVSRVLLLVSFLFQSG